MPVSFTYDHRLKRTEYPVWSTIHKLAYPLDNSLNRANRHTVESEPLAALRVSGVSGVRRRDIFVSISCLTWVNSTGVWRF